MALIDTRAPVTSHVRRDGAQPQARKTRELIAPTNRKFRPTVRENDERSPGLPTGQVERRVAGRLRYVLSYRKLSRHGSRLGHNPGSEQGSVMRHGTSSNEER